jgi:hypothetical protein
VGGIRLVASDLRHQSHPVRLNSLVHGGVPAERKRQDEKPASFILVDPTQLVEAIHDVNGGLSRTFTKFLDLDILFALVPRKGGLPGRKLKDYGPACRKFSFQQFGVATSHQVFAIGGGNVRGNGLLVNLIPRLVENVTQVDHVRLHEPSWCLGVSTHLYMDHAFASVNP